MLVIDSTNSENTVIPKPFALFIKLINAWFINPEIKISLDWGWNCNAEEYYDIASPSIVIWEGDGSESRYIPSDSSFPQISHFTFLHLIVASITKRILWCSLGLLYKLAWQKIEIDGPVPLRLTLMVSSLWQFISSFACLLTTLKTVTPESTNLYDIRLTGKLKFN